MIGFHVTPVADQNGRRSFDVWLYDVAKPRRLGAANVRSRFACAGLLGVYRTPKAAEDAARVAGHIPIADLAL